MGDRRVLFVAAALPIMLILVIGFVGGRTLKAPLGIVAMGRGPLESRLVQLLEQSPSVQVRLESNVAAERDDVLRGKILGALLIPANFDSNVRTGQPSDLRMLARAGNTSAYSTPVAVSAAYDVLASEWSTARSLAAATGTSFTAAFEKVTAATDRNSKQATTKFETGQPGPYSYTTPANLVLFVFLTLLVTSGALVESRKNGLLRRMLASPTRPGVVVLGQLVSSALLGLAQGAGLLIVGRLVFGVHWGNPFGVLILLVVLSLAASGACVLLGTLARSQEQAVALGIVIAVALGMLGGCMWTLAGVGPLMRMVGHIAPQAWAMDAFVKLVYNHSGVVSILPDVGVLAVFAVTLLGLATLKLRSVAINETAAF